MQLLSKKEFLFVWRCMYRASYCDAYINQRDAQILVNGLYFFSLNGSACFGLSLIHHEGVPARMYQYSLLNVVPDDGLMIARNMQSHLMKKIKTVRKNLCISLVYIHTTSLCVITTQAPAFLSRNMTYISARYMAISPEGWGHTPSNTPFHSYLFDLQITQFYDQRRI